MRVGVAEGIEVRERLHCRCGEDIVERIPEGGGGGRGAGGERGGARQGTHTSVGTHGRTSPQRYGGPGERGKAPLLW
jgi:hypothetical protein